ncbi:MAG TPA: membrane protein insertase YidC [Ktedonobacterales bacterium]|nr:membrane protein insertase YidC [Ktedonobacterales bacterium]
MGSAFSGLGSFFGTLFSPITTVFHWVFFLPVFNILILIYHGVGNFALAIILLTLLIRGALFPLTRRQLASTRKMQELQPRLKALQAQHRGDPQAAMAAQQALYKEHGVSMYGGCLPLVIQMPFLYALFYSFESVLSTSHNALQTVNQQIYPFLPKLAALPSTHFLWTNLATPDTLYILPVLAGILTFIQMRMAMPVKRPGAPSDATTQTTQSMQYIMPLFTVFIGTRFPAGLALYWTVSTGFSAVQQYLLSGWGSLFVGVPGMERFVPPPKDLAPMPAIAAGAAGRGAGRGVAAVEPTEPQKPGGFLANMRELLQQTREQAASQALVAQQQQQEKRGRVVEAGEGSGAIGREEAAAQLKAQQQASQRDKRARPPKSGAMLVRPADQVGQAAPVESAADLEASTKGENPEDRIARDAQGRMDGIIADAGARLNGASSAPNSVSNGTSGASGGQTAQPRPNVARNTGNAGSSGSQRRNQQSRGRNRKGGR